MRTSLEHHVITPDDATPHAPLAFIMGIDERLCVVGGLDDRSDAPLELSAVEVELSDAKDALISIETRTTSIGAVMAIHNYHTRSIRYRAFVRPAGRDIQPTSVCPVRPDIPSLEHWPYSVDVFSVGDFKLLESGAEMSCY